jgi:uncharacterized protein involved in exopolysaccharide biosynthesis
MTESTAPATAADLAEVIAEMEAYRDRLLQDVTDAAQRAKLTKAQMMTAMGSDLDLIESKLQQLREQHAALTASN